MIIDTNKVQALLDDKTVSYDYIALEAGLSRGTMHRYRNGQSKLSSMTIETAAKLQDLYDKKIEEDKKMDVEIKGLKKAVGEYNKWQEQARIYFDKNELEVWANVYPGGNESWDNYHDKNIVEVASKRGAVANDNDYLSMRELKNICANKL